MSRKKSPHSEFILSDMAKRLKSELKRTFGSIKKFCDVSRMSQSQVSNFTSGAREPMAKSLFEFALYGIDINYLLVGNNQTRDIVKESQEGKHAGGDVVTDIKEIKAELYDLVVVLSDLRDIIKRLESENCDLKTKNVLLSVLNKAINKIIKRTIVG